MVKDGGLRIAALGKWLKFDRQLLETITLCSFERTAFARTTKSQTSGDHAEGVPPVPISNTEVKTSRAKDTWSIAPGKVGHRQVRQELPLRGSSFCVSKPS